MPDSSSSNLNFSTVASGQDAPAFMDDLLQRLRSESIRNQLQVVQQLSQLGEAGRERLMAFLQERQDQPAGAIEGSVYQTLLAIDAPQTRDFLQTYFPQGLVPLLSEQGIDYLPLQQQLAQQNFQAADSLTLEKLCALAGSLAAQRKWLYFTEVEQFPVADLRTINALWLVHSQGRFGYTVQRELWLASGKDWEQLWSKIGWKSGNNWTRYPGEFTWNLEAPRGHLPLSNQLRGVRVIHSLFTHPAWS